MTYSNYEESPILKYIDSKVLGTSTISRDPSSRPYKSRPRCLRDDGESKFSFYSLGSWLLKFSILISAPRHYQSLKLCYH